MAQAKDKTQYITAWNIHVDQLSGLSWPLSERTDMSYERFLEIKQELKGLILKAAEQEFKGE